MNVHKSVLLHETIDELKLKAGDILLDGTIGGGGHAAMAAQIFQSSAFVLRISVSPLCGAMHRRPPICVSRALPGAEPTARPCRALTG